MSLMLLLRHYLPLKEDGIAASELADIEHKLDCLPGLCAGDFEAAAAKWKGTGREPTVEEFLDSVREQCALQSRRRQH